MNIKLKDIGIILTIITFAVGGISAGAVMKKTVSESEKKIEKLESAQNDYAVKQGTLETKIDALKEDNKELKQELKEELKAQRDVLLEAIKAKKR